MHSQADDIAAYLKEGNSITPYEALIMFGTMRLAARIHDLKCRGMNIQNKKRITDSGKHVAEYHLVEEEESSG